MFLISFYSYVPLLYETHFEMMLHCMDKVNELLDKLELTSFSQFSSAVVQAYDQYHRRITGHGQGASLQLTSRLGNTKSATPHVISTARLFIL